MTTKKEQFKLLSNQERMNVIERLHYLIDIDKIVELLTSVDIETLDTNLLGELGRAYNNKGKCEEALVVFEMIPEEQRDARWHCRCGYSYMELAEDLRYDFETQAKKALDMLNKAVQLAGEDDKIADDCLGCVYYRNLKYVFENNMEKYPYIAEKYAEYVKKEADKKIVVPPKVKTFKKITVEDIKNINDTWDILEPMDNTINIYDSYEEYMKSAEIFTIEQRYLFAINWYYYEVNNGGHHQFFFNSTGIVWEDVINGFKCFGMNDYAKNFQKVIDYFGGTIPFDREERCEILGALEEKNEEEFFEFLDKVDNFVYEYTGEDNELAYIKANPEKFVFDGYYYAYK